MKIELEIPDEWIPKGWRVDGIRYPKKGEKFINLLNGVERVAAFNFYEDRHIILKRNFQIPTNVKLADCWFSKDSGCDLTYVSTDKPVFSLRDHWTTTESATGYNFASLSLLAEIQGVEIPDPFEGCDGGSDCLAFWDAKKRELTSYGNRGA